MIEQQEQDTVTILRMNHGKVNAVDLELLEALESALNQLEQSACRAVILTGNQKAFSAGVDLYRVLNDGKPYLMKFLPAFDSLLRKLLFFPKPVIAAVNGHAIAGGAVFTCACDYRILAAGTLTIGLPELIVGVPFPALALEIVRFGMATQFLQEVIYTGRTYLPEEGLKRGLVDEIVSPESLMDRAMEWATKMGKIPQQSFRIVKRQLRLPVLYRLNGSEPPDETARVWSDPEIHTVIRDYLQRTIGKKSHS